MPEDEKFRGSSPESFAAAAQNAVADYEQKYGVADEPQTFKVEEMFVVAQHNPIHEYIVMLRRHTTAP